MLSFGRCPVILPNIFAGLLARRISVSLFASYAVSNLGRVQTRKGVISWGHAHTSGYRLVKIAGAPEQAVFCVHRLVAFAFHGPPPTPCHVVNHIDGNRQNNVASNLEYATHSQNRCHALQTGLQQTCRSSGKLVLGRPAGVSSWQEFLSITAAAKACGISNSSVSRCCSGTSATTKGMQFRFAESLALPGEEWVDAICPIDGCLLDHCKVSSFGPVEGPMGLKTYGSTHYAGYKQVLCHRKPILVHRLVFCSFQGRPLPPASGLEVNHKDGYKANNRYDNLEAITRSENLKHAWRMKPHRTKRGGLRAVEGRCLGDVEWQPFKSVTEAALHCQRSTSAISKCCNGRQKHTAGWEWRYTFDPAPRNLPRETWRTIDLRCVVEAWKRQRHVADIERSHE